LRQVFLVWFAELRDTRAAARIAIRLARVQSGLMRDVKFFGGIGELRIDDGPGYRIYFVRRGRAIIVQLCGGDKSTQKRDISRARALAQEV
jgi:putative addiction module killer protein